MNDDIQNPSRYNFFRARLKSNNFYSGHALDSNVFSRAVNFIELVLLSISSFSFLICLYHDQRRTQDFSGGGAIFLGVNTCWITMRAKMLITVQKIP